MRTCRRAKGARKPFRRAELRKGRGGVFPGRRRSLVIIRKGVATRQAAATESGQFAGIKQLAVRRRQPLTE